MKRKAANGGLVSSTDDGGFGKKNRVKDVFHEIKQTTIDTETGRQRTKNIPAKLFVKDEKRTGETWIVLWQGVSPMSIVQLAIDGNLTGADYRVFHVLLAYLDLENNVVVNQSEVGKMLGMGQANVARSLGKLLQLEIISKGPKVGRACTYRLNPATAWKGALQQGATEKRREVKRQEAKKKGAHLSVVK